MKRMVGRPAAPGIVRGTWVRLTAAPKPVGGRVRAGTESKEVDRLTAASLDAAIELEALGRRVAGEGHPDEAAIFEAQASIARDPALTALAAERIERAHDDAIAAVRAAAESFAQQLRSLDDELLAARAADVIDVGDRIARGLAGTTNPAAELARPAIVVAEDLPPSLTATLPRERLLGIALEGSSPTAHAAILARAYGIPAVVGVRDLLASLAEVERAGPGDAVHELALDGATGAVVIDPDAEPKKS
jgi:phosphoenolpyruvate-protein kinase (PTS system EI component)